MNLLEPLPNQQHTIKDKEESQDLECLNPAMTDMIHTMKKTNYSRSKQSRVFLYIQKASQIATWEETSVLYGDCLFAPVSLLLVPLHKPLHQRTEANRDQQQQSE